MIQFLLTSAASLYAGAYIAQNYDICKLKNPVELLVKKIQDSFGEER